MRGRAELEQEIAVPEAFEFGVDLKSTGPGMVRLSLFSEVCTRRGKSLGKVLTVREMILGRSMSFGSFSTGDHPFVGKA